MLYLYKKIGVFLFVLMFIFITGDINLYASENNNVIDYLEYLSEEETNDLQNSINNIKNKYGLDVVIVITDDTEGKNSRDYADDFYDYNGYGVDEYYSGLLLLINMEKREIWISTTGKAISMFSDNRIDKMVGHVTKYLSDARYYDASKTFINDVKSNCSYFNKAMDFFLSLPAVLIAFVISLIVTIIISISSKGKVTINSKTYEGKGAFKLKQTKDQYIRETTTRVKMQSSSGGSSTHIGSSGRSHGGGGGRF